MKPDRRPPARKKRNLSVRQGRRTVTSCERAAPLSRKERGRMLMKSRYYRAQSHYYGGKAKWYGFVAGHYVKIWVTVLIIASVMLFFLLSGH